MSRMTHSRSSAPNADAAWIGSAPRYVCPFCGSVNEAASGPCPHCTMENTPAGRKATKTRIGPWYVLQRRNPAAPGMKFDTLLGFVRKGRIKAASVVRGPTTHQLWRFACQVKGLSREFGVCYSCAVEVTPTTSVCPRCNRSQEPPARPDEFLENPNFSAVATGRPNVFRHVSPPLTPSATPSPISEAAEELRPSSAQVAEHQAAQLQQMEQEHAASSPSPTTDLGETTYGAVVSAHEVNDGNLHTDLILPALGLPHGEDELPASPIDTSPSPLGESARPASRIMPVANISAIETDELPPRQPSTIPVTTRVTGGPRVVPRLALPPQPRHNGTGNGAANGSAVTGAASNGSAGALSGATEGSTAEAGISRPRLARRDPLPIRPVPKRPLAAPPIDAGGSADPDAGDDEALDAGSIGALPIETALPARPKLPPRAGVSRVKLGVEAAIFLLVLGAAIFAGLLYVDPHLQQETTAWLHWDQHPDATPTTTTGAATPSKPVSPTATPALSATHVQSEPARRAVTPPAPVPAPTPEASTATPAPAATAVAPHPEPTRASALGNTDTHRVAAPADGDSAINQARTLWNSVFDAEQARDYAKAVSLMEQIQRLPREDWPGALEPKLKQDRAKLKP